MSREIECPSCGMRIPLDAHPVSSDPGELPTQGDVGQTVETVIPATVCLDEESRKQLDESGVALSGPTSPDPFGIYVAGDGPGSSSSEYVPPGSHASDNGNGNGNSHDRDVSDPELHIHAVRNAAPAPEIDSDSSDALRPAPPDPVLDALHQAGPAITPPPADPFLAQFSPAETPSARPAPPPLAEPRESETSRKSTQENSGTDEAEVEYEEEGRSLGSILLTSYASALTIALLWLIWTGRVWQGPAGPPSIPSDSLESVESGAFLRNLPSLPIGRRTSIGKPLQVGDLEITPLTVASRQESLVALNGRKSKAEAGTLTLTLRLRNLSDDETFTPFEPQFVRAPDRGIPESVLVAGDEPIFPYPLALQSEHAIQGQNFDPLPPGAEREQTIVSAPDAIDKLTPSMTWRLRVRTGPDQTDTIGVDFQKGDVEL